MIYYIILGQVKTNPIKQELYIFYYIIFENIINLYLHSTINTIYFSIDLSNTIIRFINKDKITLETKLNMHKINIKKSAQSLISLCRLNFKEVNPEFL